MLTVHKPATPTMSSQALASLLGGGEAAAGGNSKHACKAGNREDHAQGAGISINGVSRTQKGRKPEAGDKPEVLEQLCAYRALQDGGHPCLDRPGDWMAKVDLTMSPVFKLGSKFRCLYFMLIFHVVYKI